MSFQETDNTEYYNELWMKDWFDMERLHPTARHLQIMIRKILSGINASSLIDVGCGIGVNIKYIRKYDKRLQITGCDLSCKILSLAQGYVGQDDSINYEVLDLGENFLNKKYDIVLCSQVLEHIKEDEKAMKNLAKMCSKYLILTVPSGKYNSTSKLVGHYRHYSEKRIKDLLQKNGFRIKNLRNWGFPFHTLYKKILNKLPDSAKKRVGLGRYGFMKKRITDLLFLLFYLNVFDKGDNIIVLAEKIN